MKKSTIIILIICFLVLIGLGYFIFKPMNIHYEKINYSKLEEKLENKESFVLVVGSSTCHNCVTYKEVIESTKVKKETTMYYIYLDDLSEEEHAKLYSKYVVSSTPTTIIFVDGKENSTYDRAVGRLSENELKDYLNKYVYGV